VLIASLISVVAITAMGAVGGKVSNVLSNVAGAMN
jgi:Flp pilus assembly pilin Flp